MTVQEMIEEGIKKGGFEGLYNSECECDCQLSDLCPCGDPNLEGCLGGFRKETEDGNFKITMEKE